MAITYETIKNFFHSLGDAGVFAKAENAYARKRVESINYTSTFRYASGKVRASMKKVSYDVQIWISQNFGIDNVQCSCARGQVACHHIGALLLHINKNISRTDVECKWNQPAEVNDEGKEVKGVFKTSKLANNYNPFNDSELEKTTEKLKKKLNEYSANKVGLSWTLAPEPEPPKAHPSGSVVEDIIKKPNFTISDLKVTPEEIASIEKESIGQRTEPKWFLYRKFRLTASLFGKVIGAITRNSYPPSLFSTLCGDNSRIGGSKAIRHGVDNEESARDAFESRTGLKVKECGLFVYESGMLGASPDGIIIGDNCNDSIIEIKCPYTHRKQTVEYIWENEPLSMFRYMPAEQAERLNTKTHNFVQVGVGTGNKNLYLDKEHDYYHQIQGQLYICKKKKCYFVVWTTVDLCIQIINFDPEWRPNLELLQRFYVEKLLPHIVSAYK